MDFVQRISRQLTEPGDEGLEKQQYVVLGASYSAAVSQDRQGKGSGGTNSASGFLNSFFFKSDEQNPAFLSDVRSRIHLTYRTKFVPIPQASDGPSPLSFHFLFRDSPLNTIENAMFNPDCFNTDIGWGCMIRTGQSLLANSLQIATLGRDFRSNEVISEKESRILNYFMDKPESPFSIHNFVKKGLELSDKKPGEWFGPAATSRSIQSLIKDFPDCGLDECFISVSSGDVYEEELEKIFAKDENSKILLLLGVKLGINALNEYYWDEIKQILGSEFSVGIAGGRPSSSLYFIGFKGDELLYLDPHNPQPSLQAGSEAHFYKSCHTTNYGRLSLSDLDPSMLIGILISGKDHWIKWKEEAKTSKIFNILDKRPSDLDMICDDDMESVSSISNDRSLLAECDYVDVRPFLQHDGTGTIEMDDNFQDVQCKKQNIMVIGDSGISSSTVDIEVENVLVANSTTVAIE